jgi:hypothetical protein
VVEPINEGDAILFMKVGTHAAEPLADIMERKRREISDAGFSMWGYGGGTCHPVTVVQPFAAAQASSGRVIKLCMQPMESKHRADPVEAEAYSVDGMEWLPVPEGIHVLGSRYALCIRQLEEVAWKLPLSQTRVAMGNSRGRPGGAYIKGRVDKACLEVVSADEEEQSLQETPIDIGVVAEVIKPYAVLLR